MFSVDQIKEALEKHFTDAKVSVHDLTGGSDHFQVQIVSAAFEGQNPIQRHRMIYDVFGADVGRDIHALSIKAMTPQEAV